MNQVRTQDDYLLKKLVSYNISEIDAINALEAITGLRMTIVCVINSLQTDPELRLREDRKEIDLIISTVKGRLHLMKRLRKHGWVTKKLSVDIKVLDQVIEELNNSLAIQKMRRAGQMREVVWWANAVFGGLKRLGLSRSKSVQFLHEVLVEKHVPGFGGSYPESEIERIGKWHQRRK